MSTTKDIPYGLCHCGCGDKTDLAKYTDRHKGWARGEPKRYLPHHYRRLNIKWRREERGYTTPCLIWQGGLNRAGYGYGITCNGKRELAHRQAWIDAHGAIPAGLEVCHHCDVPACGDVAHLFLGTHAENVADCVRKGRHAHGEHAARAKLTAADAVAIRTARHTTGQALAALYGVSPALVSMIRTGKIWKSA